MAYRLKLDEPIGAGLLRIGLEQFDRAGARLDVPADAETAVHDVRKALKRLRALLKLMRGNIASSDLRRESRRLRRLGRRLSTTRDQSTLLPTVQALASHYGVGGDSPLARLRKSLADQPPPPRAELPLIAAALKTARRRFAELDPEPAGVEAVVAGLGAAYGRGRRAFKAAYRAPAEESFHELRKAAQLHWRHSLVIEKAWPDAVGARIVMARRLSALLGAANDLSTLGLWLRQGNARGDLSRSDRTGIVTLINARQAEIREAAHAPAAMLYAEPRRDLERRLIVYWRATQAVVDIEPAKAVEPAKGVRRERARVVRLAG